MIAAGHTFLSSNPAYDTKHLYIIIVIVTNCNEAIIVNVTTKKENKDDTCILRADDHDFIKHDSVINYGDTIKTTINKIEQAIDLKIFIPQNPVSDDLLKKILEGALNSPDLPPKFLKYIPRTS